MPSVSSKQERFNYPCEGCGKDRFYTQSELGRGRHETGFCQRCGVISFNRLKIKKSEQHKKEYKQNYYQTNRECLDQYRKVYGEKQRLKVIEKLGSKCAHCNETDPVVLQIDHVFNDGSTERKLLKNFNSFVKKLFSGELNINRYQLLCCNCNWRKEYNRRKNAISK